MAVEKEYCAGVVLGIWAPVKGNISVTERKGLLDKCITVEQKFMA